MKICFVITSAIDIDGDMALKDNTLHGTNAMMRSVFTPNERFEQTMHTILNIAKFQPDATMFVVDVGRSTPIELTFFRNVEVVKLDEETKTICQTHESKGYCESKLMAAFLTKYADRLREYDYIVKMSGRYEFTKFDASVLTEENLDKFLVKRFWEWDWSDSWGAPAELNDNGKYRWAPTVTYAIGRYALVKFCEDMKAMPTRYENSYALYKTIDYEPLFYLYVVRGHKLVTVDWRCAGLGASTGEHIEV